MRPILSQEGVTLRPATPEDKRHIFFWLAHSNITAEMLGPPNFPDAAIPTWEQFDEDYPSHYFDDSQPWMGRCFVIESNGESIGQISYNAIDPETRSTELDIWLADKKYTGSGLGTIAIQMLCTYLHQNFQCTFLYIAPSRRNKQAIKAYEKVGFKETVNPPAQFMPDYHDAVVLVKVFDP